MRLDRAQVWAFVRAERIRLADDLSGLPPQAWATASLCRGWDVHDVLAHLVDTAKTSRLGFARRMIAARFDFDGDNDAGIAAQRRADPRDTVDALRAVASLTLTPIAPRPTRLVEAIVHGEDIRRPLGLAAAYDGDAIADALAFQVRSSAALGGGRERVQGLRVTATDCDFDAGTGDVVRGRGVDLLLAVSGRPVDAAVFGGPGVARLVTA